MRGGVEEKPYEIERGREREGKGNPIRRGAPFLARVSREVYIAVGSLGRI
jgi:hypothetical protein